MSAVEEVRRWQAAGGRWRVVSSGPDTVVVGLYTCDGGEEMGRVGLRRAELAELDEPAG